MCLDQFLKNQAKRKQFQLCLIVSILVDQLDFGLRKPPFFLKHSEPVWDLKPNIKRIFEMVDNCKREYMPLLRAQIFLFELG